MIHSALRPTECLRDVPYALHVGIHTNGTTHGSNEYPFLIDETGISVLPITSLRLDHEASTKRVSTGIERLDEMLGGGYFKGTTILCSGSAGTGPQVQGFP